jgi:hypothetical protein
MAALFIFSQINPLESTKPENIKQAVIMSDCIFFEIVEDDKPQGKTKPKSQFLMTQIDQFNIPTVIQ